MVQLRDLLVKAADITGVNSTVFEKYRSGAISIGWNIKYLPFSSFKRQLQALRDRLDFSLDLMFVPIRTNKMDKEHCLHFEDGKPFNKGPDVTPWIFADCRRLDVWYRITRYRYALSPFEDIMMNQVFLHAIAEVRPEANTLDDELVRCLSLIGSVVANFIELARIAKIDLQAHSIPASIAMVFQATEWHFFVVDLYYDDQEDTCFAINEIEELRLISTTADGLYRLKNIVRAIADFTLDTWWSWIKDLLLPGLEALAREASDEPHYSLQGPVYDAESFDSESDNLSQDGFSISAVLGDDGIII
ncbi:uncharacterized protein KD926_008757 [Aspergillus affinis]|uniref:uncharacterized protein n=1 Tax=Aspergillus affinis TaxID=1070780 RepID=UPI0022FED3FF|nr:uncharacterized protein KD926_008757 [Aspergillus affinis]KAI9045331.1 hypothetical protein KD926_008757 [Aspergillus affinis]